MGDQGKYLHVGPDLGRSLMLFTSDLFTQVFITQCFLGPQIPEP